MKAPMVPPITCVMVTGKSPERIPLARAAVNAFLHQSYGGVYKLLIVNDGVPVLPEGFNHPRVTETIIKAPGKSLGELRNLGTALAGTPYIMQWDDDDFPTQTRIQWQVAHTDFSQGEATIFKYEILCNLIDGQAFVACGSQSRVRGFAGTMLYPRVPEIRFPEIGKHEDTEFLLQFKKRLKVLDNDPALYIRFYHGHNTWSEKHVMNRRPGSHNLDEMERQLVDQVLKTEYAEFRS